MPRSTTRYGTIGKMYVTLKQLANEMKARLPIGTHGNAGRAAAPIAAASHTPLARCSLC